MAVQTKSLSSWLAENPTIVTEAIKSQIQTQIQTEVAAWISKNGQAVTNASAASMKAYMEQNLRPLQDGVFIGKLQYESWGTYMRIEEWQRTNIGITAADADAIVVQMGGYRLGIALDDVALPWGSAKINVTVNNDLNSYDGKQLTAKIMASDAYKNDDPTKYAVAYAYNYKKSHTGDPGGASEIGAHSWWLPSMGDLSLIHQHFETINLAIARINAAGKQQAQPLQRTFYWSCQERSPENAWVLNFYDGYRGYSGKSVTLRVRPVTAF